MNRGSILLIFKTALITPAASAAIAFTNFVNGNNFTPVAPYTNWSTAAQTIQDAVDACPNGGTVIVTNGVYQTGGRTNLTALTNRVVVTNTIAIRSINGPSFTMIVGNQVAGTTNGDAAVRCMFLTNGAAVSGFTITGGATLTNTGSAGDPYGGGIYCIGSPKISNCVFFNNSAYSAGAGVYGGLVFNSLFTSNTTYQGGGAAFLVASNCVFTANRGSLGGATAGCTLLNCILTNNAASSAGGASDCYLTNCLVANNSADFGGGLVYCGAFSCTIVSNSATTNTGGYYYAASPIAHPIGLYNCIIISNTAPTNSNFAQPYAVPQFCCTSPTNIGLGNFSADPHFVNAAAGDYRLQSNSPCINSGLSSYVAGPFDLAGNPRVSGGTVDLGAYEFQSPKSLLSYAWAINNNLPIDGSADFLDPDGDGVSNYAEWMADTNPHNPTSFFRIDRLTSTATYTTLYFNCVSNRAYTLYGRTNVNGNYTPMSSTYTGYSSLLLGISHSLPSTFYKVRVSLP